MDFLLLCSVFIYFSEHGVNSNIKLRSKKKKYIGKQTKRVQILTGFILTPNFSLRHKSKRNMMQVKNY